MRESGTAFPCASAATLPKTDAFACGAAAVFFDGCMTIASDNARTGVEKQSKLMLAKYSNRLLANVDEAEAEDEALVGAKPQASELGGANRAILERTASHFQARHEPKTLVIPALPAHFGLGAEDELFGFALERSLGPYSGISWISRLQYTVKLARQTRAECIAADKPILAESHENIELAGCQMLMDRFTADAKLSIELQRVWVEATEAVAAIIERKEQAVREEDEKREWIEQEKLEVANGELAQARQAMGTSRQVSELYREVAVAVNGRLGPLYELDRREQDARHANVKEFEATQDLDEKEKAAARAESSAAAARLTEGAAEKAVNKAVYQAERSDKDADKAYKKEDYKAERKCRAQSKELWEVVAIAEEALEKTRSVTEAENVQVHETGLATAQAAEVFEAAQQKHAFANDARESGWLVQAERVVDKATEHFHSDHFDASGRYQVHPLPQARFLGTRGDMKGAVAAYARVGAVHSKAEIALEALVVVFNSETLFVDKDTDYLVQSIFSVHTGPFPSGPFRILKAILSLLEGDYHNAATQLSLCAVEDMAALAGFVSVPDIALITSLASAASLTIEEIERDVLNPLSTFRPILESAPDALELLVEFGAGNIARVAEVIRRMQAAVHYDFFLSRRKPFFAAHAVNGQAHAGRLTKEMPAIANETHKHTLFETIIGRCQAHHLSEKSPFGDLVAVFPAHYAEVAAVRAERLSLAVDSREPVEVGPVPLAAVVQDIVRAVVVADKDEAVSTATVKMLLYASERGREEEELVLPEMVLLLESTEAILAQTSGAMELLMRLEVRAEVERAKHTTVNFEGWKKLGVSAIGLIRAAETALIVSKELSVGNFWATTAGLQIEFQREEHAAVRDMLSSIKAASNKISYQAESLAGSLGDAPCCWVLRHVHGCSCPLCRQDADTRRMARARASDRARRAAEAAVDATACTMDLVGTEAMLAYGRHEQRRKQQQFDDATARAEEAVRLEILKEVTAAEHARDDAIAYAEQLDELYEKMTAHLQNMIRRRDDAAQDAKDASREVAFIQQMIASGNKGQYELKKLHMKQLQAEAESATYNSKETALRRETIDHSFDTDKALDLLTAARETKASQIQSVIDRKARLRAEEVVRRDDWAAAAVVREEEERLAWETLFLEGSEQLEASRQDESTATAAAVALAAGVVADQGPVARDLTRRMAVAQLHQLELGRLSGRKWKTRQTVVKRAAGVRGILSSRVELFEKTDERSEAEAVDVVARRRLKQAQVAGAAATEDAAGLRSGLDEQQAVVEAAVKQRAGLQYKTDQTKHSMDKTARQVNKMPGKAGEKMLAHAKERFGAMDKQLTAATAELAALRARRDELGVALAAAETLATECAVELAEAVEEAEVAKKRLEYASGLEMEIQKRVQNKLNQLVETGWSVDTLGQELEFKSLLFRKMLDGKLGCQWTQANEENFKQLMHFKRGTVVETTRIEA